MNDASRQNIERFKYFVTVDPDGEISHFGLGKAYFDAGTLAEGRGDAVEASAMFAEAIGELQRVLTIKPDYAACFLFLGLAQQKSGDKGGAMKTYEAGMTVAQKNGTSICASGCGTRPRSWRARPWRRLRLLPPGSRPRPGRRRSPRRLRPGSLRPPASSPGPGRPASASPGPGRGRHW